MKKLVALLVVAFVAVGVSATAALAAAPQGKLTGSATMDPGGVRVKITTPVLDGGTTFVGLPNDFSGNCLGDSGVVSTGDPLVQHNIVCAHFVASSRGQGGVGGNPGSPKMRFAWESGPGLWTVGRIVDNGPPVCMDEDSAHLSSSSSGGGEDECRCDDDRTSLSSSSSSGGGGEDECRCDDDRTSLSSSSSGGEDDDCGGQSPDTVAFGLTNSMATVISWVNRGVVGSGQLFGLWGFLGITTGDYTVQASQL